MAPAYSRRIFIKQNSLTGLTGLLAGNLSRFSASKYNPGTPPSTDREKIAGITLNPLRDHYKAALFNRFLSDMKSLVIDHEYGGFMCDLDNSHQKS